MNVKIFFIQNQFSTKHVIKIFSRYSKIKCFGTEKLEHITRINQTNIHKTIY